MESLRRGMKVVKTERAEEEGELNGEKEGREGERGMVKEAKG